MSLGPLAIGQEWGYSFEVTNEFEDRLGYNLRGTKMFYNETIRYYLIELGPFVSLYRGDLLILSLNAYLQYFLASQLTDSNPLGLHYSFTTELNLVKSASIFFDVGYSLGFDNKANQLEGSPYFGKGFSLMIGPRFYLH